LTLAVIALNERNDSVEHFKKVPHDWKMESNVLSANPRDENCVEGLTSCRSGFKPYGKERESTNITFITNASLLDTHPITSIPFALRSSNCRFCRFSRSKSIVFS
jgi:hypothetical protein